jgi:hypothetical protein
MFERDQDAIAGYDSGFFYGVPVYSNQRGCPQTRMKWNKWVTEWRRWSPTISDFSVDCIDANSNGEPPLCTLITASCSGPYFTIQLHRECQTKLTPFVTFNIADFQLKPDNQKDTNYMEHCKMREKLEFNAGECDTILKFESNGGTSYTNRLEYIGDSFTMTPVVLKCRKSPVWWSQQYTEKHETEISYDHIPKKLISASSAVY